MKSSSDSGKSPFFVRKATGLVRDFSAWDMLFLNVVSFGGAWSIIYALEYVPLYGGNPIVGLLLTAPGILALLGVYYIFQVSMPRSGGDYIFMGRALHPAIALAANFAGYTFFLWFWIGDAATVFTQQGLAQTLSVYGSLTGATWATNAASAFTPMNTFIIGTIVIAIFAAVVLLSTRLYFRIQNVAMIIAVIGLVIIIGLLASTTPASFANALNSYSAKQSAPSLYQSATTVGQSYWGGSVPQDFNTTLLLVPLFFTVLFWVYVSNYCGGETKEVRRSARTALFGSFAIIFFATLGILAIAYKNLGADFLAGAGNYAFSYANNPLGIIPPNLTLFAAVLANNSILVWFIGIGVVAGFVMVAPQCMILMSRILFSYSFDRVVPSGVADVNERFHTPWKGILIAAIGGEVFLAFLSGVVSPVTSQDAFALYSYAGLAAVGVTFTFVALSAIVFPYRRRSLYETSSPVKRKIAGVPLISWLGIIALAYTLGTFVYYTYKYQFYFFSPTSTFLVDSYPWFLGIIGSMFIGAIVWFYVARWYRSKSGIPFDKAFQEIPPE